MKRKIELFMILFLLMGAIIASWKLSELTANVSKEEKKAKKDQVVIVVDPGHGGEDPGKVGINDVLEKDLNLQIAKKVKKLLEEAGIKIVMTRTNDKVPDAKKEDLNQRVQLINDTKPKLALCIHQNSYPDAKIKGAQVFYHTITPEAEDVASIVQEQLQTVDPTNTRQIKENDTYFMLKNTQVPTIIVECGFLTNPEEAAKLTQEDYQDKLAQAICEGVVKWLNGDGEGEAESGQE
ncbi:MAG: N-acetylmuramoyl-L-alanine amidase [Tyzzerella sp.]|nr:N-acetylmuramoyl-L-alanine amidase [Tyzzerella sp.]